MHARRAPAYGREKGGGDRTSAPALRAAFPKVTQLQIALAFDNGSKSSPSGQVHTLFPPSQAYFTFPCPAAGCDGSFQLGSVIENLVGGAKEKVAGELCCTGMRPHPRSSEQCTLQLKYKVEIHY